MTKNAHYWKVLKQAVHSIKESNDFTHSSSGVKKDIYLSGDVTDRMYLARQ